MRARALPILMALSGAAWGSPVIADVFKYMDAAGNVIFSDKPLPNPELRLEWKRTGQKLVAENRVQTEQLRDRQRERETQRDAYPGLPRIEHSPERQRAAMARLEANVALRERLWVGGVPPVSLGLAPLAVPKASASLRERRAHFQALIDSAARQHRLSPELVHAVIRAESAYRPDALSPAGASGLMQLMPGTAKRFKVQDIWDPAQNIQGGTRYLRFLLDLFDSDLRLALAGYNAGENAVKRHGNSIPPFPETQEYVRRVLKFLHAELHGLRS